MLFTQEEYERTEKNYCAFMLDVLKAQAIHCLEIVYLKNCNQQEWAVGQRLNFDQISEFVRNCLREECWGQLMGNDFIFECGYDFYIHIAVLQDMENIKSIAKKHGLFIDKYDEISIAPYYDRR